jgi:hypothetical protein
VHHPENCFLDGVVSIEGVKDPVFAIIISSSSYPHFVSYAMTLASFYMIGLDWRRLSSSIVFWVGAASPWLLVALAVLLAALPAALAGALAAGWLEHWLQHWQRG